MMQKKKKKIRLFLRENRKIKYTKVTLKTTKIKEGKDPERKHKNQTYTVPH